MIEKSIFKDGANKNLTHPTGTSGITLIALVVTIVVLLILAGVSIATLTGENGILTRSYASKKETEEKQIEEQIKLAVVASKINDNHDLSIDTGILDSELKNNLGTGISINKKGTDEGLPWEVTKGDYKFEITEEGKVVADGEKINPPEDGTWVSATEIFDINGKNESDEGYDSTKLHIGDFVNYDAGEWTTDEINAIRVGTKGSEVTANNSTTKPSTNFEFGGFGVGTERNSRNGNATPYSDSYNYVRENGEEITGWRVFDVVDDGSITLISAGCPEDYYHPYATDSAYISEYILTGNINSNATSLNLDTTYTKRDWNDYVNQNQKATGATVLTKQRLDNWYSKYMGITSANTHINTTFQSVLGTKYETMVDNYAYYWLSSAYFGSLMYYVYPDDCQLNSGYDSTRGVRVLVSLSSEVKLSETSVGTKTVTDSRNSNNSWTYNVWNLK